LYNRNIEILKRALIYTVVMDSGGSSNCLIRISTSLLSIATMILVVCLPLPQVAGKLVVIPPTASPFGRPYSEWTADWWRWYIQTPFDNNHPSVDRTGAQCARSQSGPVWYLSGSEKVGIEKTCIIPKGKAILVPILNTECSYVEDKSITNVEGLRTCTKDMADHYTGLKVIYDGVAISDSEIHQKYRVVSSPFKVNFPAKNVYTASPPGNTTSVSDGYWVFLEAPSPGNHELKFGGCYQSPATNPTSMQPTGNFCQDVTYHLKVLN
jgi:hypothetical protein